MNGEHKVGDVVLGNWTLSRLIGEGSYGRVYEATREDFGVTYSAAIKIITIPQNKGEVDSVRSEGMDEKSVTAYFRSMVEEIVREFSLMSQLKGTANVVSYEDHAVTPHENEVGWDIIIRMELLTPLLKHPNHGNFSRDNVIKLGIDICKALELCQQFNIVHRDIKPENIFVSHLGDYKLGDFGIARTIDKTTSGLSKKGTYTYMAPEVYKENAYGRSVDIYSLGLVLYRLLNDNRAPFLPQYPEQITFAAREEALAKRMTGEPLPTPRHAGKQMAEIIRKACAYDPKDRYSSPAEMREDLELALEEGPKCSVDYAAAFRNAGAAEEKTESLYGSQTVPASSQENATVSMFRVPVYERDPEPDTTESTYSSYHRPRNNGTKKEKRAERAIKRNRWIIGWLLAIAAVIAVAIVKTVPMNDYNTVVEEGESEYEEETGGPEEGAPIRINSFTVTGQKVDKLELHVDAESPVFKIWKLSYGLEGQEPRVQKVVGSDFILSGLEADSLYEISIEHADGYAVSGETVLKGRTLAPVRVEEIAARVSENSATVSWVYTGVKPESWTVATTGTYGYSDKQTVTENTIILKDLQPGESYNVQISCDGLAMSASASFEVNERETEVQKKQEVEGQAHIHDYRWTVTQEATCTQTGGKTGVCSCGESIDETIEKISHQYIQGECISCNSDDPNYMVEEEEYLPVEFVTVKYRANGGISAPEDEQYYIHDGSVSFNLPTEELERDGYIFVGWRYENDPLYDIDDLGQLVSWNLDGSTTLTYYAQWERADAVTFTEMAAYWDTSWGDDEFFLKMTFEYEGTSSVEWCEIACWDSNGDLIEEKDSWSNDGSSGGVWACIQSIYYGSASGSLVVGETYYWKATVWTADGLRFTSDTQQFVYTTEGTRFG